ncbi:hypothetical protein SPONL_1081 [uncultured Candidatus Thioglobus sp.]|nr:hypothetical protein SPONL_1081 [uncultured Candidatus Thioglobus sp.]
MVWDTPEIRGKCEYEKDLVIKARDLLELNYQMLRRLH